MASRIPFITGDNTAGLHVQPVLNYYNFVKLAELVECGMKKAPRTGTQTHAVATRPLDYSSKLLVIFFFSLIEWKFIVYPTYLLVIC